jgi:hypothetical protein
MQHPYYRFLLCDIPVTVVHRRSRARFKLSAESTHLQPLPHLEILAKLTVSHVLFPSVSICTLDKESRYCFLQSWQIIYPRTRLTSAGILLLHP